MAAAKQWFSQLYFMKFKNKCLIDSSSVKAYKPHEVDSFQDYWHGLLKNVSVIKMFKDWRQEDYFRLRVIKRLKN